MSAKKSNDPPKKRGAGSQGTGKKKKSSKKKKPGRPAVIDDEVKKERFLEAIRCQVSIEDACKYAGFTVRTLHNIQAKGEKATRGKYFHFLQAYEQARLESTIDLIKNIRKAGERDWRANAFLLERRDPDTWGKRAPKEPVLPLTPEEEQIIEVATTAIIKGIEDPRIAISALKQLFGK